MSGSTDLDQELKKLQLKQLQHDTNWSRWSIPAASVIFSAATIFLSLETLWSDSEKSAHDHALACATLAASEASIISTATTAMSAMTEDQKNAYVDNLVATFPPDAAEALSNALSQQLTKTDGLNFIFQVIAVNNNNEAELKPYSMDCKTLSSFVSGNPYAKTQNEKGAP